MADASTIPVDPGSPAPPPPAPGSTQKKAVSGAALTIASQGVGQGIRLAASVLIARFVTSDVYGVMALVTLVNQALQMLSDVGIGQSIVQHAKGDDERFLRTAWTMQVIRSVVLTAVGIAVAYPVAAYYETQTEPRDLLFPVIVVSVCSLLISGLTPVSMFLATRTLSVARVTAIDIATQLTALGVSLFFAWQLKNVWALVIGNLASALCRMVLAHVLLPRVPLKPCLDPEARRELWKFGKWVWLSTLLTFAAMNADRIMLPKLLEDYALFGLFGIALSLCVVPVEVLQRIGAGILLPAYARTRRDGKIPPEVFDRVAFVTLLAGGVAIAGVVGAGPGFIRLAYKPSFHAAAALIPWLALVAWARVLQVNAGFALLALGQARSTALAAGAKLVALVVLIPAGFWIGREIGGLYTGLIGAIAGTALSEFARYGVFVRDASRAGLRPLGPDTAATARVVAAGGLAFGSHIALSRADAHPALDMMAGGAVAVLVFTPWLWRAWRMVLPSLPIPAFARLASKPSARS